MWVLLDMYRRFQTSFGLKDRRIKKSFFLVMNTSAKRRVAFAEGTLPPREAIIALSIVRHENLEHLGYTEYTIQMYRCGRSWVVFRRYRHFEALHKDIVRENEQWGNELPTFPQKRWFEKQRWMNRFDENYSLERRKLLQIYLRELIKLPYVLQLSSSLRAFLEIPESDDLSQPIFDYELRSRIREENLSMGRIFTERAKICSENGQSSGNAVEEYEQRRTSSTVGVFGCDDSDYETDDSESNEKSCKKRGLIGYSDSCLVDDSTEEIEEFPPETSIFQELITSVYESMNQITLGIDSDDRDNLICDTNHRDSSSSVGDGDGDGDDNSNDNNRR